MVETPADESETVADSVFSPVRNLIMPTLELPDDFTFNTRLKLEGSEFLALLPPAKVPVAFLDPQYRGLLD